MGIALAKFSIAGTGEIYRVTLYVGTWMLVHPWQAKFLLKRRGSHLALGLRERKGGKKERESHETKKKQQVME